MKTLHTPLIILFFAAGTLLKAQVSNEQFVQVALPIAARLRPAESLHFTGYLGQKLDLCIENRVKAQDIPLITEPFRHREETHYWQTEFWGKWMLSAAKAYEYSGDKTLRQLMSTSVQAILSTQSADGYIGNYADDQHLAQWDVWGRKYTLLGLLYWYDLSGDAQALQGAIRLADHLLSEVGPGKADIVFAGNYRGMAASSVLEPIVLLYQRTGEARYLEFAEYIVSRWESPEGPQLIKKALLGVPVAERFPQPTAWWSWENGMKAYEMMSCYDGLLKLYQLTGEARYLQAVQKTFENIRETEINLAGSGASMECWYGGKQKQIYPARHSMETCVTTTWIKLAYELYRLTGDASLVDEIEKSAYNNLLGSMHPDGHTFCKYSGMEGFRSEGEDQCEMPINCCVANGPRGLMLLPDLAVMTDTEGIVVNMYDDLEAHIQLPSGHNVTLSTTGNYPVQGAVNIQITPEQTEKFAIKLRVPTWSSFFRLAINGVETEVNAPGTYVMLMREWKKGDQIAVSLDMRGKIVTIQEAFRTYHTIVRGPILLAYDNRMESPAGWEMSSPIGNPDGTIELEPLRQPGTWLAFRVPFRAPGAKEQARTIGLPMIDFSSAGNAWDYTNRYQVFIPEAFDPGVRE